MLFPNKINIWPSSAWNKLYPSPNGVTIGSCTSMNLNSFFLHSVRIIIALNLKLPTTSITKEFLPVILTKKLSWNVHCSHIIASAYKSSSVEHSATLTVFQLKKQLYLSLVSSQLIYVSQIWRPILVKLWKLSQFNIEQQNYSKWLLFWLQVSSNNKP